MPESHLTTTHWRRVPGYEGIYSVSRIGQVRRDMRFAGTNAKLLKLSLGTDGYEYVRLSKGGVQRYFSIHRLVALCFLGECPKGCNVNHKNGDKTDNRLENLEYVTYSENSRHAYRKGLAPVGEKHGLSKLTTEKVKEIKRLLKTMDVTRTAKAAGVPYSTVNAIAKGRTWRDVPA